MADYVALLLPFLVVGAIAVGVGAWARRRVPRAERTGPHWRAMRVYLAIVVVAAVAFVPLAVLAIGRD